MEQKVFNLFGRVLVSNKPKFPFSRVNDIALKQGIFVPDNLCYRWLYVYLRDRQINTNSTFYESWEDIRSRGRWELFLDQVCHYISTYGTNFEGRPFIMNDGQTPDFPYKELKVLEGITEEELRVEVTKLAYSNIAMSEETLTSIQDIVRELGISLDLDQIKNRELKLRMIPADYKFKDGQECLLWILWKWFNISMLVKNKATFDAIKPERSMLPVLLLNGKVLATVFYRNKDVFMQFKKCKELCHAVNMIRKFAVKLHKPMKKSPWLQLEEMDSLERMKLFKDASIFKLTQMYNVLNNPTGYYVIRNGKAFYRESVIREVNDEILDEILSVIASKVPKVESVALPKGIELAMPTSEKNFIGEVPLGSYIDCAEKNTMIGIYWRNEWGARDLDLHVRTIDGSSIGWNAAYRDEDKIFFSGDMTNAEPEASEVMWFQNEPADSIVSVLEYRGNTKYCYEMFIAQESTTNFSKGYMVDPRNIIYKARMEFENKSDVTLGFFKDNKFVFHSCNVGNGRVPNDWRIKILEHLQGCKYLMLRDVLELNGITISDDSEIKLNSKGDLINFFSL